MPPTRRDLLRLGLGGSTLLACGPSVPTFLARSAAALAEGAGADADGRILVVVQLDGGNDGLNTVVPFGDDRYYEHRPKLALNADELKTIDDHVGFHPRLDDFAGLLDDGRLAVVQSVGYPNPSRSHFESMAVWQAGRPSPGIEEPGWLARALDAGPSAPGGDSPALHIAEGALPQAIRGGSRPVPSLAGADPLRRRLGGIAPDLVAERREALDRIASLGGDADAANPLLPFIARSTVSSFASLDRIEQVLRDSGATGDYPESYGLARRLRLIAQFLRAGLTTPIYYTRLDGFDTHADQLNRHASLLRELGRSLRAFLDDLETSGDADRVVVLVFSEFGRRLAENASRGTDHGTSAPVFLLGRPVEAGLHGPSPDLNDLDDLGDPKHAIDFRRVYAEVLEHWLSLPSRTLGDDVIPLPLLLG